MNTYSLAALVQRHRHHAERDGYSLPTVALFLICCASVSADELAPISPDEPITEAYSLDAAHAYLDQTAANWVDAHGCITCHTNGLYLLSAQSNSKGLTAMRQFAREYIRPDVKRAESAEKGTVGTMGIVASTALLTISESRTEPALDPLTREALDFIWTLQNESGCWEEWAKCNWPPYEADDHFGATLVAIAAGHAPGNYSETPVAKVGLRKLRQYFADHPPTTMHQRAMLLWASHAADDILTDQQQQAVINDLFSLQKADGGWNLVTLGSQEDSDDPLRWRRVDGTQQDRDSSDGYATGFAVYVLRQAAIPADDPRIVRAVAWLKAHQRTSGRWFTRSPRVDSEHYISNAGTSFAVLALRACGE